MSVVSTVLQAKIKWCTRPQQLGIHAEIGSRYAREAEVGNRSAAGREGVRQGTTAEGGF